VLWCRSLVRWFYLQVLGDSEKPCFASLLTLVPEGKCPDSEVKARGIEVARIVTELPGALPRCFAIFEADQRLENVPPAPLALMICFRATACCLQATEAVRRA
jgi:hypothetical protein